MYDGFLASLLEKTRRKLWRRRWNPPPKLDACVFHFHRRSTFSKLRTPLCSPIEPSMFQDEMDSISRRVASNDRETIIEEHARESDTATSIPDAVPGNNWSTLSASRFSSLRFGLPVLSVAADIHDGFSASLLHKSLLKAVEEAMNRYPKLDPRVFQGSSRIFVVRVLEFPELSVAADIHDGFYVALGKNSLKAMEEVRNLSPRLGGVVQGSISTPRFPEDGLAGQNFFKEGESLKWLQQKFRLMLLTIAFNELHSCGSLQQL